MCSLSRGAFTIPRYQNIDRSRHLGVEVGGTVLLLHDLSRQFGLGRVGDTLALRLAYTWSHFVFVDDPQFNHNQLPGAPEHFCGANYAMTHPVGVWGAPGIESVPAGYAVNSDNTAQTDPYTLFNLRLGYDYKPWNLSAFFEARNLTDKRYAAAVTVDDANGRFFLPGDGRAFYGGVSWRWK